MCRLVKVRKWLLQYFCHILLRNIREVKTLVGKYEVILSIINYTSLSCSSVQVQAKQHQFTSEMGLKHVALALFPNNIFR